MSRSLRRGVLAAVLAVTIAPLAAACGAGSDPQSLEVKPDSVATSVGDVAIQNAYIITEPSGHGPASVTARVFNNSTAAQQITSISVKGATSQVALRGADGSAGPITIPAGGSVTLGGKGDPAATLSASTGVVPGNTQTTVFTFSSSGQVTVAPIVTPAREYFSPYGPATTASPSPSTSTVPGPTPSGSAAPAGGTPVSPGASTSAAPGKHPKTAQTKIPASGSPSA